MNIKSIPINILIALYGVSLIGVSPAEAKVLAVPCVNGGGSGGWMMSKPLPHRYYPIVILKVQEWPLRNASQHPSYNQKASWNKYGTCAIVASSD